MEFESFYDGVLLHIGVGEKQSAPVDALLAIIGKGDEDVSAILQQIQNTSTTSIPTEKTTTSASANVSSSAVVSNSSSPTTTVSSIDTGRIKASPLAKKISKRERY
jgi:pyruvate dehydrogenase E2 component (dihydrolipoamide acetyltransferase)